MAWTIVPTLAVDDAAGLTYVLKESPDFGLFAVNSATGAVTLNVKPSSISEGKGTGTTPSNLEITVMKGQQKVAEFDIQVVFEYCGLTQECDAQGTQQCRPDVAKSFTCDCNPGFVGMTCSVPTGGAGGANFGANGGSSGAAGGDSEASSSGDSSNAGAIVGVVVALLFIVVAIVAAVLFSQARTARNAAAMSGLGSSSAYAANPTMGMPPQPFVRGRKNAKTYPYYEPTASRQSSYQLLGSADAGKFVVRDAADGGFHLHYKTAQMVVKDATIATEGRSVTLSGHGNQQTFPCLPMLVEHYASNMDGDSPIQLSVDKPIYFRDDGSSIYDNAAIKSVKTDYSASSSAI